MTHPPSPTQGTPGGGDRPAHPPPSALQSALDLMAARLADDRRACDELAVVLRLLGRRPEDDPDYLRWCRAAADLEARLAAALAAG